MSDFLAKLMGEGLADEMEGSTYDDSWRHDFLRASITPAYIGFRRGQAPHVFEISEDCPPEAALKLCQEAIAKDGVDWKPKLGMSLVRYGDSPLSRETAYEWEGGTWQDSLTMDRYQDPVEGWKVGKDWEMMRRGWQLLDDDGNDISPLQQRYGKVLWMHIERVSHPEFVRDDPTTHDKRRSRVTTVKAMNELTGQEEETQRTVARDVPIIRAAFETRDELVAYMEENGVEVKFNLAGNPLAELSDEDVVAHLNGVAAPIMFTASMSGQGQDADAIEALWEATKVDIGNRVRNGEPLAALAQEYNGLVSENDITAIKTMLELPV